MEGRNAPTLINAVYNKHQFWDGRATYLEEVVQRTLEDESVPTASLTKDLEPEYRHVWFNVVGQLRGRADYLGEFERVFGTEPTQDNVAKALATYVRTILSGDAVYDRAEAARQQRGGTELEASDFAKALDPVSLKALTSEALSEQQVGAQLDLGHRLFLGHGRCVACHKGPLFTDHDFHNIGVGESRKAENILDGKGNGYFAHAPTGLKDKRYIGAFKTPTLRALPRTAPYMHRGEFGTLRDVLRHYNTLRANLILTFAQHLDPILLDGPHSASDLRLEDADLRRLELFLKALDGGPVPPKVAEP